MTRIHTVVCDNCGKEGPLKPHEAAADPRSLYAPHTWSVIGGMDFCTPLCRLTWEAAKQGLRLEPLSDAEPAADERRRAAG